MNATAARCTAWACSALPTGWSRCRTTSEPWWSASTAPRRYPFPTHTNCSGWSASTAPRRFVCASGCYEGVVLASASEVPCATQYPLPAEVPMHVLMRLCLLCSLLRRPGAPCTAAVPPRPPLRGGRWATSSWTSRSSAASRAATATSSTRPTACRCRLPSAH